MSMLVSESHMWNQEADFWRGGRAGISMVEVGEGALLEGDRLLNQNDWKFLILNDILNR